MSPRSRPPQRPVARVRWRSRLMVLAMTAAIGMIVILVVRRPRTSPPLSSSPVDVVELLPPERLDELIEQAKSLQLQKRFGESLPGVRLLMRQHELNGRMVPELMIDYAGLLNNAAFQGGSGAPRSSFERIALEREAFGACQRAMAMANTPRQRAETLNLVGLVLEAWGFRYDAYLAYRHAVNADSTYAEARAQLNDVLRRDPAMPPTGSH
jgi:hypothetical protein